MMVSMHASARTVQRCITSSGPLVIERTPEQKAALLENHLLRHATDIPKMSYCWCIDVVTARLWQAGVQQRPRRVAQQRPRHAAHAPRGQHACARRPAARAAHCRRAGARADAGVYAGVGTAQQPRKAGGPGRQRVAGAGARIGNAHPQARPGKAGALCGAHRHERQLRAVTRTPRREMPCNVYPRLKLASQLPTRGRLWSTLSTFCAKERQDCQQKAQTPGCAFEPTALGFPGKQGATCSVSRARRAV